MKNNNVKKVLSIDMDYIMAPSIQLYNDLAGNPEFQNGNQWEKLQEMRNLDEFLKYDEEKLLFVADLLAKKAGEVKKEDIFFAKEHDMILEFLCGDEKKKDFTYDIYNVDHHHDIYYGDRQREEVDRFDFACLANWVYYLGKNEKIEKYHWLRNKTSALFPDEQLHDLTFPVDFNLYGKESSLFDVQFDYIFVCLSAQYFPKKFNQFYELMRIIASGVQRFDYDVWDQPYCIDGKTRHVVK